MKILLPDEYDALCEPIGDAELDHVIVAGTNTVSMASRGLI